MLTGVNLFLSVIMMKQNVISFVFRYPVIRAVKGLKGNQNIFLHEGCVGGWGGGGTARVMTEREGVGGGRGEAAHSSPRGRAPPPPSW